MNDDELERLLSDAFDARARDAVDDTASPPPPRFAAPEDASASTPVSVRDLQSARDLQSVRDLNSVRDLQSARDRHSARHGRAPGRLGRLALPLSAAAAVVTLVGIVLAVVNRGNDVQQVAGPGAKPSAAHVPSKLLGSGAPVHIKLHNDDGATVGVGMPVIAYFSKKITSARALQHVTTVTAGGRTLDSAWYFERSNALKGYPYEAHLRAADYWPADSAIHVSIPAEGVTAGKGLRFDDSLTLDFRTGPSHILTVDDTTHRMTLTTDGHTVGSYPVSLGAKDTPTRSGTKVIMEKGQSVCMKGPGYDLCGIKYTQRLTYDGEFLHAAPWNTKNIGHVDTSNGCTNLTLSDAKKLFGVLRIGDVVKYPNADGPPMQLGVGYGDWNVPWPQWRTGGAVPTE